MIDKKYLIANGCSFTAGHILGPDYAWPKFLGEKLNLQVYNIGKGGSGNDSITWRTIEFCEVENEIAKNSLFVIQLTECLRYHVYYDNLEKSPQEWHVTPICFTKSMNPYATGNDAAKWIYKNREELFYIYNNITFALYKTYQNIITLTSYFESKKYPYIIFDGINDHKPYEKDSYYYIAESNSDNVFKIDTDINDFQSYLYKRDNGYQIHKKLIESLFSNKNICKEIPPMLKYFLTKGYDENGDREFYFRENGGHPNGAASDIWADILKEQILNLYKY